MGYIPYLVKKSWLSTTLAIIGAFKIVVVYFLPQEIKNTYCACIIGEKYPFPGSTVYPQVLREKIGSLTDGRTN
jgi:hypothetical protein